LWVRGVYTCCGRAHRSVHIDHSTHCRIRTAHRHRPRPILLRFYRFRHCALALRTDDWWSHGGRRAGCICMCSIYFDFWATSFSLYEWLSAAMQGTLSASATASARLLFVPSRAQLESLPKDEKSTPEDERNRAEWQREVHRIRRTLGSVLFLRAGKGVRASISLRNSSCRILMQFCRIAVRVIVIGAKDSSHASQERTVVAARRRSMTHR